MHTTIGARVSIATLLVLLVPTAWADDADESTFSLSISGLHRFSDTLDTIRDKGLGTYISDQVTQSARENFPDLFGNRAEGVDRAIKAGEHVYGIQSKGLEAFDKIDRAESLSEGQAALDDWDAYLSGEKLPEMLRDIAPESLRNLADNVRSFTDDANWVADKAQSAAGYVQDQIQSYFSGDASYGLEPGGSDQRMVMAMIDRDDAPRSHDQPQSEETDQATFAEMEPLAPPRSAFADEIEALQRELGIDPDAPDRTSGSTFADDIADLAGGLGAQQEGGAPSLSGGAFADDLADLAADLGIEPGASPNASPNWAREVRDAEAGTVEWQRREEEKRRIAAAQEKKRQEELARLAALQEEQRQEQLAWQQQQDAARIQQQMAYLEQRRVEIEADLAADRRREAAARVSEPSSSGGGWRAILGGVLQGAAKAYVERQSDSSGSAGADSSRTGPHEARCRSGDTCD